MEQKQNSAGTKPDIKINGIEGADTRPHYYSHLIFDSILSTSGNSKTQCLLEEERA